MCKEEPVPAHPAHRVLMTDVYPPTRSPYLSMCCHLDTGHPRNQRRNRKRRVRDRWHEARLVKDDRRRVRNSAFADLGRIAHGDSRNCKELPCVCIARRWSKLLACDLRSQSRVSVQMLFGHVRCMSGQREPTRPPATCTRSSLFH
jgi:hypothetical protein